MRRGLLLAALLAVRAGAGGLAGRQAGPLTLSPVSTLPGVTSPILGRPGGGRYFLSPGSLGVLPSFAVSLGAAPTPGIPASFAVSPDPEALQERDAPSPRSGLGRAASAFSPRASAAEQAAGFADIFDGARKRPEGSGVAAAPPAPLKATENGFVETANMEAGLHLLREASHPMEPNVVDLLGRISQRHPGLPLDPERVFLMKDRAVLDMLDLPSDAAGAARVLSDGKRQEKVILLVAPKGITADDFVEFVIHEALHLMDGGILHVENNRAIEHWLAEGYTQLRAHEMANASLEALGRHARKNPAYDQEVALVRTFISKHGTPALEDLVRNGSSAGLKAALGERWKYVKRLMAFDNRSMKMRADLLSVLYAVIMTPGFGEEHFAHLIDRFGLAPPA